MLTLGSSSVKRCLVVPRKPLEMPSKSMAKHCLSMCDLAIRLIPAVTLAASVTYGLMSFNRGTIQSVIERYVADFFKNGQITRTHEFTREMVNNAMQLIKTVALPIFIISILLVFALSLGGLTPKCSTPILRYTYFIVLGSTLFSHVILMIVYMVERRAIADGYVAHFREASLRYRSLMSLNADSIYAGFFMASAQCCGYENGTEFLSSSHFETTDFYGKVEYKNLQYPVTCCKMDNFSIKFPTCPGNFTYENSNIFTGCSESLNSAATFYLNILAFTSMILIFTTLVTILVDVAYLYVPQKAYSATPTLTI